MVKIRLKRMGTKARPFYRIVVAKAMSGRDSADVEILGVYNPIPKVKVLDINQERALHWLLQGAQPTETVAYLLKKCGVLDKLFEARPNAKTKYKFLDKRTAVMSTASVIETSTATAVAEPVVAKVEEAPVVAASAEVVAAPVEVVAEAPKAEEAETPQA